MEDDGVDDHFLGDELDALMAAAEEDLMRDIMAFEDQADALPADGPSNTSAGGATAEVENSSQFECADESNFDAQPIPSPRTEEERQGEPQGPGITHGKAFDTPDEERTVPNTSPDSSNAGEEPACEGSSVATEAQQEKYTAASDLNDAQSNASAEVASQCSSANAESGHSATAVPDAEVQVVVRRRGKPKKSKVRLNKERALREAKARAEALPRAAAEAEAELQGDAREIDGCVTEGNDLVGETVGDQDGSAVVSEPEQVQFLQVAAVLDSQTEDNLRDSTGSDTSLGDGESPVIVRRRGKKKPKVRQNKERALREAKARAASLHAGEEENSGPEESSRGELGDCTISSAVEKEKRAREELLREQRAQIANLSDAEKRRHQKRAQIVHEIITTEKSYLDSLEYITETFLAPAAQLSRKYREVNEHYPAAESAMLCTSTAVILGFSRMLLDMLVSRFSTWQPLYTCIGDVFLSVAEYLKSYTNYVNCYEPFVTKLAKVLKKDKDLQGELCMGKSFLFCESKLIIPVQRIPRYLLLLRDLLGHTTDAHPDYSHLVAAVEKIESIGHYINEQRAKYESMNRVLLVEKTFGKKLTENTGINKFIRSHRFVAHEGELLMHHGGKVKKVLVYLLNDVVVIGKAGKASLQWGGRALVTCFPLWTVCLLNRPCEPRMEHMFELVANETGDPRALLQAANADEKDLWIEHIKVVLNHLNNAIALGANCESGKTPDEEHLEETFALLEKERRVTLAKTAAVALKPKAAAVSEASEPSSERGSTLDRVGDGDDGTARMQRPGAAFLGSRAMRQSGNTPPRRHLPLRSPSAPSKTRVSSKSSGGGWTSVRVQRMPSMEEATEARAPVDVAVPSAIASPLAPASRKQLSLLAESEQEYLGRLRSLGSFLQTLVDMHRDADAGRVLPKELFGMHTAVEVLITYTAMHCDQCEKLLASSETSVPGQLGDVFLQLTEYFHVYVQYLRDFEPFVKALSYCLENKELRRYLKEPVNFEELLVCPILRIDYYEEQLRLLVTFTGNQAQEVTSDSDHAKLTDALGRIQELCSFVSERREFYNSAARLLDVIWLFGDSLTEGAGLHCSFLRSHRLLRHGGILVLSDLTPSRGRSSNGSIYVCDVDEVELAIGELCSVLLFNDVLLVGQLPRTAGAPAWGSTTLYCLVRLASTTVTISKDDGCSIELSDQDNGELLVQLQAGDDDTAAKWLDRIENILMSLELARQRGANAPVDENCSGEGGLEEPDAQDELPRAVSSFLKMQTMMTNRSRRLTLLLEGERGGATDGSAETAETVFKGISRRTMTPIHAPQSGLWRQGRLSELPIGVPELVASVGGTYAGKSAGEDARDVSGKQSEFDKDVDMEITILCTRYQDQLRASLQFPVIAERHRRVLASGLLSMVTPVRTKKVWMYLLNDCVLISSVEGKVPGNLLLSSMRLVDVRTLPCKVGGKPGFQIVLDLNGKVQGEFIVGNKEKLNDWIETVVEAKRLLRQAMSAGISEEVDTLMAQRTDVTPGSDEDLNVRRQLFDEVGKSMAAAEDMPATVKDLLWEQAKARDQIVRARQRASSTSKFPKWLQLSGK